MTSLTDAQNRYLALAWLCVDVEPKIDYERFALLAGSKTANSAREMLRVTKKKLHQEYASVSTDGTVAPPNTPAAAIKTFKKKATPKTKSTGKAKGGKKRKITNDSDEESDAGDDTPIKKKNVVKKEPVDEDSDAGAGAAAEADAEDAEV
ncbi:hypothetical protein D6D01_08767 [Aureobasidium pullulans]|uniref:Uncharacterized protein n=1 Tax=Aureobasidium pullulans TaxID=5580 RepID=A0A4S9K9R6_AURPU|nr:hypothetical protein D6D01_08767 [Aureobasidium pullulans]